MEPNMAVSCGLILNSLEERCPLVKSIASLLEKATEEPTERLLWITANRTMEELFMLDSVMVYLDQQRLSNIYVLFYACADLFIELGHPLVSLELIYRGFQYAPHNEEKLVQICAPPWISVALDDAYDPFIMDYWREHMAEFTATLERRGCWSKYDSILNCMLKYCGDMVHAGRKKLKKVVFELLLKKVKCIYKMNLDASASPQSPYSAKEEIRRIRRQENFVLRSVLVLLAQGMFEGDDALAMEELSRSCMFTKQYPLALKKARIALDFAEGSGHKIRLGKLVQDLSNKMSTCTKESLMADEDWINEAVGQSIVTTRHGAEYSAPREKRRHKRPKKKEKPQVLIHQAVDGNESTASEESSSADRKTIWDNLTGADNESDDLADSSYDHLSEIELDEDSDIQSYAELSDYETASDTETSENFLSEEEKRDPVDESIFKISERLYSGQTKKSDIAEEAEFGDFLRNGIAFDSKYLQKFQKQHRKNGNGKFKDKSKDELHSLLQTDPRQYKRCIIQIKGSHLAYCTPVNRADVSQIEIPGRFKAGQSFSNDEVVVRILQRDGRSKDGTSKVAFGEVVGILRRKRYTNVRNPVFVCNMSNSVESPHAKPLCKTIPKIYLMGQKERLASNVKRRLNEIQVYKYDPCSRELKPERRENLIPGKRENYVLLVVLLNWSADHPYPRGAVIHCSQPGNSLEANLKVLNRLCLVPSLYQNETIQHTKRILQKLENGISPRDDDSDERVDYSHLQVYTIDDEKSTDLDDGLSVQQFEDGSFEVGVHIADVSAYVKKDDPIDKEAMLRAFTFYPEMDSPRHMLPEPFIYKCLSLLPGERRKTLSVFFTFSATGEKGEGVCIQKTFVKCCRLSYKDVQLVIDNVNDEGKEYENTITHLHKIAKSLRKTRLGNAAYAVDFEDQDSGTMIQARTQGAKQLVEEFMILTNFEVAKQLVRHFPDRALLRCQLPPPPDDISNWLRHDNIISAIVCLQDRRIPAQERAPSVSNCKGKVRFVSVLKDVWKGLNGSEITKTKAALRCLRMDDQQPMQSVVYHEWLNIQQPAEYKCNGTLNSQDEGSHFSLGLHLYTHFTSPIRRYADIIVHRLLHSIMDKTQSPYATPEVKDMSDYLNLTGKQVKTFDKSSKVMVLGESLRKQPKYCYCYVEEVSESNVTLYSPTLASLALAQRKIPFSLLDVRRRIEIQTDQNTGLEFVTANWQCPIYDVLAFSSQPSARGTNEVTRIDPHQYVEFITISSLAKILNHIFVGKVKDVPAVVAKEDTETARMRIPFCTDTVNDVSTEVHEGSVLKPFSKFSMSFSKGQVLKVQYSAAVQEGKLLPIPQFLELTPNVGFCLEHRRDPVQALSKHSTKYAKNEYREAKEYLRTFLPLVHMEAATNSVRRGDPFKVRNVPFKFFGRQGKFYLGSEFCQRRNIDLNGGKLSVYDKEEKQRMSLKCSGDWICIQYQDSTTCRPSGIWIAHGKITDVKRKEERDRTTFMFELHEDSPAVPDAIDRCEEPVSCTIEVLVRSEVDKRMEAFLHKIKAVPLAHKIATIGHMPSLDKDYIAVAEEVGAEKYQQIGRLPKNNTKQQEAVDIALTSSFSLIQGPPGTGKSYTGIKLIHLYNKINKILDARNISQERYQLLFCGPSNTSVDQIAKWLKERLQSDCPKLVRVYGGYLVNQVYTIPGRYGSIRANKGNAPDDALKDVSLHNLIRMQGKPHAEEINKMDALFRRKRDFSYQDVHNYRKLVYSACVKELKDYEVILCTLDVATNPKILDGLNVFQMIIDEAGMCPEPRCLAPIIANKAKQVVLIGDHKQLQPVIQCRQAEELGLSKSLFERYSSASDVKFTFLDTQYRMNRELCAFPSKQFYEDRLRTGRHGSWHVDQPLAIWPRMYYPHVFCDVFGVEETLTVNTEEGNEMSKRNRAEAQYVKRVFEYLVFQEHVSCKDINVISQYNSQCHLLKELLKNPQLPDINVNTVVKSQGGEWDYVIFSLVRSLPDYKIEKYPTKGWCHQNLGFITDHHQINVALTRARKGLIIVGNKNLLGKEEVWSKLIEHYETFGCVTTPDKFPPQRRPINVSRQF